MKIIILALVILTTAIFAGQDAYVISQQAQIKVSPYYQTWEDDGNNFSELSIPFYVYYPFSRSINLSILSQQANASGDNFESLNGFSDTQLNLSYFLESYKLVINAGVNLPSGKKELTADEFETSRMLSLNHFNFRTPNFGQGLNISLGATWAFPLSKNIVIGFGGSYQLKGGYRPISDLEFDYKPGNEILITTGFDIAISKITSFSIDGIFTTYSADKYNNDKVIKAGNKISFAAQFRQYIGYNDFWLLLRYRTRARSSLPIAGILTEQNEKTVPNNIEMAGHYRFRINQNLNLTILGNGRIYQKSFLNGGVSVYGSGVGAQYLINRNWDIMTNLKYYFGSYVDSNEFSGFEIVIGLGYNF